jgi:hypothetical protein
MRHYQWRAIGQWHEADTQRLHLGSDYHGHLIGIRFLMLSVMSRRLSDADASMPATRNNVLMAGMNAVHGRRPERANEAIADDARDEGAANFFDGRRLIYRFHPHENIREQRVCSILCTLNKRRG